MTHASVQCVVDACTLCPCHECPYHAGTLTCVLHKNDCPACTREDAEERVLCGKEWDLHDEFKRDHPISHWWHYNEGKMKTFTATGLICLSMLTAVFLIMNPQAQEDRPTGPFVFMMCVSLLVGWWFTEGVGFALRYFDGHAYEKLRESYESAKSY